MGYTELVFNITSGEEYQKDLLVNTLAGIGFDTFEDFDSGFKAYISSEDFDQKSLDNILQLLHSDLIFTYQVNIIPQKNWNEVWESNFEPLIIADKCYVRATFHDPHPEYPFEIVIDPKMAFGTGHHQTTSLMIQLLMEEEVIEKAVLDMGCGTGILAILASKAGASRIDAIDYDPICYDSTLENSKLNHVTNIEAFCGSKETIPSKTYDIILANINRNILLDQLKRYTEVLALDGVLFLSGFYEETDLDIIKKKAINLGLQYSKHLTLDSWVAAKFISRDTIIRK